VPAADDLSTIVSIETGASSEAQFSTLIELNGFESRETASGQGGGSAMLQFHLLIDSEPELPAIGGQLGLADHQAAFSFAGVDHSSGAVDAATVMTFGSRSAAFDVIQAAHAANDALTSLFAHSPPPPDAGHGASSDSPDIMMMCGCAACVAARNADHGGA